jgi:outer membrane protein assembly factor BamB
MGGHTLEGLASLVRNLGSACTLLRIADDDLLAGSQEGELICWSVESGTERWRVEVDGPLSDLAIDDGRVYASASASLHAIDLDTGEILWSRGLEGASDYVQAWGGSVWAVSSVYEIEVSDYTESTVWRFDGMGELQERWTVPERAWHFGLHEDGGVLLGLGRPRCGFLRIRSGEEPEHHQIKGDSPVTVGACGSSGRFLIGHSDGSVSTIVGSDANTAGEGSSPVRAITGHGDDWIAGQESGQVVSSRGWTTTAPGSVDSLSVGPSTSEGEAVWASSWKGDGVRISVLDPDGGGSLLELDHGHRTRHIQASAGKVVLGDSRGRIHLIEAGVLTRRVKESPVPASDDENRERLMERLRQLRDS